MWPIQFYFGLLGVSQNFFFGILEKKSFLPTYLDLAEVCISTPLRPGAGAN